MNHNRRKVLTEQENEIPEYDASTDVFGSVVSCRSSDVFDVQIFYKDESKKSITVAARMPSKFKHVIWAKAGDLVILRTDEMDFQLKTPWYIHAILSPAHAKHYVQQGELPDELIPEKLQGKQFGGHQIIQQTSADQRFLGAAYDCDDEDDELPEINNRRARPFADSSDEEESD